jgi:hypothetical protein
MTIKCGLACFRANDTASAAMFYDQAFSQEESIQSKDSDLDSDLLLHYWSLRIAKAHLVWKMSESSTAFHVLGHALKYADSALLSSREILDLISLCKDCSALSSNSKDRVKWIDIALDAIAKNHRFNLWMYEVI